MKDEYFMSSGDKKKSGQSFKVSIFKKKLWQ